MSEEAVMTLSEEERRARRGRSVRLALMLGALALVFYVGSFFFLTN